MKLSGGCVVEQPDIDGARFAVGVSQVACDIEFDDARRLKTIIHSDFSHSGKLPRKYAKDVPVHKARAFRSGNERSSLRHPGFAHTFIDVFPPPEIARIVGS